MYLQKLYDKLHITDRLDKIVLAAIVLNTYHSNHCNVTAENHAALRDLFIKDLCSPYEFEIIYLGAYWVNDMVDMLCEHVGLDCAKSLFVDHIWPFMREHEPLPGVKMAE